jgi:hypothetical protein
LIIARASPCHQSANRPVRRASVGELFGPIQ